MRKYKAVIFDLDGTMSPKNSWLELTNFLGADPQLHIDIFQKFMENSLSLDDAKKQLLDLWLSSAKAFEKPIRTFFKTLPLRENAREIIEYLRGRSIETCLISSTVDICVEEVASTIGIKNWYADSRLIFDEKGNLADLIYQEEQLNQKLKYFEEFLALFRISPEECLVIGDGENDIILFEKCNGGLTIGDSVAPKLKKIAKAHIDNLIEIKDFL
jgi:phosphoserine phosphatase